MKKKKTKHGKTIAAVVVTLVAAAAMAYAMTSTQRPGQSEQVSKAHSMENLGGSYSLALSAGKVTL